MKPSFRLRLLTAYPRLRSMAQVEIRAIVVGGSAVIGADDGDADLVVVTAGSLHNACACVFRMAATSTSSPRAK
jgi:hypothetical protein